MERLEDREARKAVRFEIFRGGFVTWNKLFQEAADFASELGPDRVINISHSEDNSNGVVTVWYWQ